jgi:putative spermidine/putrescine transport system ATP-binding protein
VIAKTGGTELKFENVAKQYGPVAALQPTTLLVNSGEFFALLGPSGSGKTTLLGIAAGFIQPSQGRVLVNGEDITGVPPERRNIGMVFQNYSLFPFLTVFKNVAFPLEMRNQPKPEIAERVTRMLAMVRLAHLADRLPSELSGGQQQRVALARAAVYDPAVLLMDEPLGALDKTLREEMQDEIKQFHAKIRATVIYVTHDQQEAAFMADRTAILNHGRVEQCGPQSELYENPRNAFVAGFLGEANLLQVTAVSPMPSGRYRIATSEGLTLTAGAGPPEGSALVACIRPANVAILKDSHSRTDRFSATVVEAVHAAESIRYRVQINERCSIVVRALATRGADRFQPNDRVTIGWEPEDVMVMPK